MGARATQQDVGGQVEVTIDVTDGVANASCGGESATPWAIRAGGRGTDSAFSATVLADGTVLIVGGIGFNRPATSAATFGADEVGETTLETRGGADVFLARYTLTGTVCWARKAGGRLDDWADGVAATSDGGAIVVGTIGYDSALGSGGDVTFGAGEAEETTLSVDGPGDAFVARYEATGDLLWVVRAGGAGIDAARSVAITDDGQIVVVGEFAGGNTMTAVFGPGEANQRSLVSAGWNDVFVAGYTSEGAVVRVTGAGGPLGDNARGVAVSDGAVYVVGYFTGETTFGRGEPGEVMLQSLGFEDAFLARFDVDGALGWARHVGSSGFDLALGVSLALNGDIVLTGETGGAMFGSGAPNETTLSEGAFVARYDPSGGFAWAVNAPAAIGFGVASEPDGGVLVAGSTSGNAAAFLGRYTGSGEAVWTNEAPAMDSGTARGLSVSVVDEGSPVIAGDFGVAASFFSDTEGTVLESEGGFDVFVARYPE